MPGGHDVITKALQVKEEGRMASVKEVQCKKDLSAIAGFEDGRGHEPRNMGSFLELEKASKQILPHGMRRNVALPTLCFQFSEAHFRLLTPRMRRL